MVRGASPEPRLRRRGSPPPQGSAGPAARPSWLPRDPAVVSGRASAAQARGQALDSVIRRGSQRLAPRGSFPLTWAFLVAFGDLGFVPVFFLVPGGSGAALGSLYLLVVITWRLARLSS